MGEGFAKTSTKILADQVLTCRTQVAAAWWAPEPSSPRIATFPDLSDGALRPRRLGHSGGTHHSGHPLSNSHSQSSATLPSHCGDTGRDGGGGAPAIEVPSSRQIKRKQKLALYHHLLENERTPLLINLHNC